MDSKKSKNFLNIITGIGFVVIFIFSTIMFMLVHTMSAGTMFAVTQPIAIVAAVILAFVISTHYQNLNNVNGDGQKSARDYFKQIAVTVLLLGLMNIAISEFVGLFFGAFLRDAALKIPLLVIYLIMVYSMFSQQGYRDANRKVYNLHLKILSMILLFITVMPGAIRDSIHNLYNPEAMAGANLQTAFSPNIYTYIFDGFRWDVNPDFNVVLPIITLLISFAIQMALMIFAYKYGKKSFLKKRLNPAEVETDEKC